MNHETLFEAYRHCPTADTLESLLRAFSDTVYTLCYRILRHPQDAEDASQKVFVEVVRRIGRVKDAEHFKRSLYRISFHVALNQKKESRARLRREREKASMQQNSRSLPGAATGHVSAIHEHLAKLDDESQALIVDYYFGGKKLGELADASGCSTVALWKRLEKAKDRLRKSLIGAGLAGMSACVESTLEASSLLPAPKDLLTRKLVERALGVGNPGAIGSLGALGAGIPKKYVLMATALGLIVATAAGVQAGRRKGSPSEPSRSGAQSRWISVPEAPPALAPRTPAAESPLPGAPRFKSTAFFQVAFWKAVHLVSDPERAKALRELGFELSEEDFGAVARESRGKRGGHRFAREFTTTLLSRWTRKDPRAAAAFFGNLPRDEEPPHPYDQITDGKTGFEFPQVYRSGRLREVVVEWAKRDLGKAELFVKTLPEEDRETLLRCLQARRDPEGLSKTLLTLEGKERAVAIRVLAQSWGEKDPKEALRWGERLPIPKDPSTREGYLEARVRGEFLEQAVEAWARSDSREALSWVLSSPDRKGLTLSVIDSVARTDPKAAAGIVDQHLVYDPSDDLDLYEQALQRIAFLDPDPEAAARMLLAHGAGAPTGPRFETLRSFVQYWAEDDDADPATRWAMNHPDPKMRSWLVVAAAIGRATSAQPDLVGAMASLKTLPEDIRRRGAEEILSAYARQHPSEAAALAESFQVPVPAMEIATELARQDLEGAITWGRSVPDAATRDKALCDLASGPLGLCWQAGDVPRAIALAQEIHDPSIRLHAQGMIAAFWAGRSDPGPVLDWVVGLPGDVFPPSRDSKDWIYHTRNSRREILDSVVATWANEDGKREAARRWIEQSSLPQESKRTLLGKLGK